MTVSEMFINTIFLHHLLFQSRSGMIGYTMDSINPDVKNYFAISSSDGTLTVAKSLASDPQKRTTYNVSHYIQISKILFFFCFFFPLNILKVLGNLCQD